MLHAASIATAVTIATISDGLGVAEARGDGVGVAEREEELQEDTEVVQQGVEAGEIGVLLVDRREVYEAREVRTVR